MTDSNNTQPAQDAQHGNGQERESEPHVTHLVPGERELLSKCYWHQVYLALCGAELPVSELQSSFCEDPGCDLMVTYCQDCLQAAVKCNADAGREWTPPGSVLLDSWPPA